MKDRDNNLEKKKRGRPAIGRGEQVNVMIRPEIAAAIDTAAADEPDQPTRAEMTRRIVTEWLTAKGLL